MTLLLNKSANYAISYYCSVPVFVIFVVVFLQSRSKTEDPQQLQLKEKAKAVS